VKLDTFILVFTSFCEEFVCSQLFSNMSNLRKGNKPYYQKMHEGDADSDQEPEISQTQKPVKAEKKSSSVSSLLFVEEIVSENDDM
jgi:hypothetical protein